MSEVKITNEQIYKLLLGMQSDLSDVKERTDRIETRLDRMETKVDTTNEHVARIDERLTQIEKITGIFDMKAVERAAK